MAPGQFYGATEYIQGCMLGKLVDVCSLASGLKLYLESLQIIMIMTMVAVVIDGSCGDGGENDDGNDVKLDPSLRFTTSVPPFPSYFVLSHTLGQSRPSQIIARIKMESSVGTMWQVRLCWFQNIPR